MVSKKLKSFNADEFMEGTANNYSLLNDRFRPKADIHFLYKDLFEESDVEILCLRKSL